MYYNSMYYMSLCHKFALIFFFNFQQPKTPVMLSLSVQTESGLLLQTKQFTGLEKGLFCLGNYLLDLTTLETANDVNYARPCNFSWYRKLNVC